MTVRHVTRLGIARFCRVTNVKTNCENCSILYSNRCLKLELSARQKSIFPSVCLLTSTTSPICERLFSHFCTVSRNGPTNLEADMLCRFIALSSRICRISSTVPNTKPRSCVPFMYLITVNFIVFHASATSAMPFSIPSSFVALAVMSPMTSLNLCNSMANMFWSVKDSGFRSNFMPVISMSFFQCLGGTHGAELSDLVNTPWRQNSHVIRHYWPRRTGTRVPPKALLMRQLPFPTSNGKTLSMDVKITLHTSWTLRGDTISIGWKLLCRARLCVGVGMVLGTTWRVVWVGFRMPFQTLLVAGTGYIHLFCILCHHAGCVNWENWEGEGTRERRGRRGRERGGRGTRERRRGKGTRERRRRKGKEGDEDWEGAEDGRINELNAQQGALTALWGLRSWGRRRAGWSSWTPSSSPPARGTAAAPWPRAAAASAAWCSRRCHPTAPTRPGWPTACSPTRPAPPAETRDTGDADCAKSSDTRDR